MDTRRRVKLYMLNEEKQWDDKGTGYVTSQIDDTNMVMFVNAECDNSKLLESKVHPDVVYQKQQETLIVWSEAENCDLALSFQEKAGCDEIWEKICQVQGKDPSVDITQDLIEESDEENLLDETTNLGYHIELPPCEIGRLKDIVALMQGCLPTLGNREKLAYAFESEGYIKKLIDAFHMCEDLHNLDGLQTLFTIFKNIFMLTVGVGKKTLFEIMFSEDMIFDVVGCLEYDPSLIQKPKHREFLQKRATLREVIPFNNKELTRKIHQTYRVQYIRDTIFPSGFEFDENLFSTLTQFIYNNKMEIMNMIQEDDKFLADLFMQCMDENTSLSRKRDLMMLLKEFGSMTQSLRSPDKESWMKSWINRGILQVIELALCGEDDAVIKSCAIEVFSLVVEFNPCIVRDYILNEANNSDEDGMLMTSVIDQLICDRDETLGGAVSIMHTLRLLLDPDNLSPSTEGMMEISEFISFFYKHCMHMLTAPILSNTAENTLTRDDFHTSQLMQIILDMLSFCVEHHIVHIKNYMITTNLLKRILVLLKSKHAFLVLAAIRLLRKIVGTKDDYYYAYILKENLLLPVVEAFKRNGHKYNLLNSAVIELFEYIRSEEIRPLLNLVVKHHISEFEDVSYVKTFKSMKLRYEQMQERTSSHPSLTSRSIDGSYSPGIIHPAAGRCRRDPRDMEEEEEFWFDGEEEMVDESYLPTSPTPLGGAGRSGEALSLSTSPDDSLEPVGRNTSTPSPPTAILTPAITTTSTTPSPPPSPPLPPDSEGVKEEEEEVEEEEEEAKPPSEKVPVPIALVDYDEDSDEEDTPGESTEHQGPPAKRARAGD